MWTIKIKKLCCLSELERAMSHNKLHTIKDMRCTYITYHTCNDTRTRTYVRISTGAQELQPGSLSDSPLHALMTLYQ